MNQYMNHLQVDARIALTVLLVNGLQNTEQKLVPLSIQPRGLELLIEKQDGKIQMVIRLVEGNTQVHVIESEVSWGKLTTTEEHYFSVYDMGNVVKNAIEFFTQP